MRIFPGVLLIFTMLAVPCRLGAQTTDPESVKLKLTGRAEVQYNTTSAGRDDAGSGGGIPSSTFETRRIRLAAELEIDDWITGVIEPEYALGKATLKNAFVNLAIDPRLQLRVGQFKKPFSMLHLTSSTKFLTIERGARIRGAADGYAVSPDARPVLDWNGSPVLADEYGMLESLGYLGFDIGAEVHGRLGRMGYHLGVFNGAGANERDQNDGKSVVSRLTYQPWQGVPLVLGAAASYREATATREGPGGEPMFEALDGTALEVDAEWGAFRRPGLHVVVEAATGDDLAGEKRFLGAQGIVANFRPLDGKRLQGVEPLVRISYGDPDLDRSRDHGWFLTPGVNLYFGGRNRFMINWDVYVPGNDRLRTEHSLKMQAQLYFSSLVSGRDGPVTAN